MTYSQPTVRLLSRDQPVVKVRLHDQLLVSCDQSLEAHDSSEINSEVEFRPENLTLTGKDRQNLVVTGHVQKNPAITGNNKPNIADGSNTFSKELQIYR